ncbi:DUF3298/DUF4163 domain-containing protein [Bacillus methanolicus]|uniref:DUF3298 and DUF4163 domain-containing protein n=1 Tax=Bacillus methanolicus TaxID=1471 RepID=UPI00238002A8|nr:DUF3298 and DUF4163 domain-containing protein [Bacillus methanolicus]MDE3840234.1 DUF3298/DUF4163 domain-containing protein [Bacillus methanolicus]
MKKWILGAAVCFALMFSSFFPHETSAKVIWDGMELKKGQIGKVTILKQTELYQLNGTKKKVLRKLKPGEVYRIYQFLPGKLGLGGGKFIDRDNRIKYQTPSKEKIQALGVKITKHRYQNTIDYPQVSGLISKSAQNKINETIKKHVRASYNGLVELEKQEKELREEYYDPENDYEFWYNFEYNMSYEIKYNENNLLSILIYDYMYTGGVHGMTDVTSYNFNVLTGQQLKLGNVAKSQTALNKIKKYAITDLTNRANRGEMVFKEFLHDMKINNDRPFYFTSNGIVIKFFEYEVAPYAAGMPEVKIPYSVFK